jgi:hypothetical protein
LLILCLFLPNYVSILVFDFPVRNNTVHEVILGGL